MLQYVFKSDHVQTFKTNSHNRSVRLWASCWLLPWPLPCGWGCLPDLSPPLCPPWCRTSTAKSSAGPRPGLPPLAPGSLFFFPFSQPRARPSERLRFFWLFLPCLSWEKISTTSWGIRSPTPRESRFDMPTHSRATPWKRKEEERRGTLLIKALLCALVLGLNPAWIPVLAQHWNQLAKTCRDLKKGNISEVNVKEPSC